MRIASLVPSATELLFELGLGEDVVAVTHECDWPPEAATRPKLTRSVIPEGLSPASIDRTVRDTVESGAALYELDSDRLAELDPELIVTQAVCEVCAVSFDDVVAVAARLRSKPPVVSLDPSTLEDVIGDFMRLGEAAGAAAAAAALRATAERRLVAVEAAVAGAPRPRVLGLEWLDPPYVAGHWVPEMIYLAGGTSALGAPGERSRVADWSELVEAKPDVVVAMPCGYGTDRCAEEAASFADALASLDAKLTVAVDASAYFSRPGPRLVQGVELLGHILHPDRLPEPPVPGAVREVSLEASATADMRAEGIEPPRAKPTSS
jgi:iron complex transport system substrate-binding protein